MKECVQHGLLYPFDMTLTALNHSLYTSLPRTLLMNSTLSLFEQTSFLR